MTSTKLEPNKGKLLNTYTPMYLYKTFLDLDIKIHPLSYNSYLSFGIESVLMMFVYK